VEEISHPKASEERGKPKLGPDGFLFRKRPNLSRMGAALIAKRKDI
jgi:hypothetical protein